MATLASALPTHTYALAYGLPLLLISLGLAACGTFFTLHRSHSFAPRADALSLPSASSKGEKKKLFTKFYLEGGIGGVGVGYAFGLHVATFLVLLIPSTSSAAALSPGAFVAVWVLVCIPMAVLGGRFMIAALAFAGITGGATLALAICIAIHPPLLARQIIVALLASLFTLLTLLPLTRTREPSLRIATASTGAFGFCIAVAVFAGVVGWEDAWTRLWQDVDIAWGQANEKGLSAGFWLVFVVGCASDWALARYLGENPDQKWDAYLAEYAATLPHSNDRAGTFHPDTRTFWDRIAHPFGGGAHLHRDPTLPPVYPFGTDAHSSHAVDAKSPVLFARSPIPTPSLPPAFDEKAPFAPAPVPRPRLQKPSTRRPLARLRALARDGGASTNSRRREAVKFRPIGDGELSSGSESDVDGEDATFVKPTLRRESTAATRTTLGGSDTLTNGSVADAALDYDKERVRLFGARRALLAESEGDSTPEYSDGEDVADAGRTSEGERRPRGGPGWTPAFVARAKRVSGTMTTAESDTLAPSSAPSDGGHLSSDQALPPSGAAPLLSSPTPPAPRSPRPASDPTYLAPAGAVPLTPSLIRALDRVAIAQAEAFGPRAPLTPPPPRDGLPLSSAGHDGAGGAHGPGERWDAFWHDVVAKAEQGARR